MRYRELTILTGVIAALALAQTPASALDVFGGRITIDTGHDGVGAHVHAPLGDHTNATANATFGGANTAGVNANLRTGASVARSLAANAVIDLSDDNLRATVDLNGDGKIDDKDTALLAKLDINGDGIVSLLDDANGDGVLSAADLNAAVTIGKDAAAGVVNADLGNATDGVASISIDGLSAGDVDLGKTIGDIDLGALPLPRIDIGLGPDPRETPPPGIPNPLPNPRVTPPALVDAFGDLNDDDIAALKIKCVDVMANPNAFNAATVSICRVLASL